jgi:hypothetical protein
MNISNCRIATHNIKNSRTYLQQEYNKKNRPTHEEVERLFQRIPSPEVYGGLPCGESALQLKSISNTDIGFSMFRDNQCTAIRLSGYDGA